MRKKMAPYPFAEEKAMGEEMMTHSPLPWRATPVKGYRIDQIWSGHDNIVAVFDGEPFERERANAAYIVKCVNAHEALVAALRWFADDGNWREEELSEGTHFSAEWLVGFDPRDIARNALKKAISP
jgi:hypothetical protein